MKKKLIVFLICFSYSVKAQIKNGIIEYKITNNAKFADPKFNFYNTEEIKKATTDLAFELKFDRENSYFGCIIPSKLTNEQIESALVISNLEGFYGRNLKTTTFDYYKDDVSFGPINIQQDANINWQLSNETKIIENYTCLKATALITDFGVNSTNTSHEISIWYCTDIPVSLGPKRFSGLPGLILEATERGVTLQVTKLNFNIEKPLHFEAPFKAKKITPEAYLKLIREYVAEMSK